MCRLVRVRARASVRVRVRLLRVCRLVRVRVRFRVAAVHVPPVHVLRRSAWLYLLWLGMITR